MSDTPEVLAPGSNELESEPMDNAKALDVLHEITSQTPSDELLEITDLIAASQDKGEAGAVALVSAIDKLADIDTAKLAELNHEATPSDIASRLDKIYFFLINERLQRQTEIDLIQSARKVVDAPSAGIGDSPEQRAQAARRAIEQVAAADSTIDLRAASSPSDGFISPNSNPVARIQQNFAIPASEDSSTFAAGFSPENQIAMTSQVIELASKNINLLEDDRKLPDTVMAVIGNNPAMAQGMLGFMGSEVASSDEIMRMSFTEFASKTGIEVPDEILARLEKPTPNNPPPPG